MQSKKIKAEREQRAERFRAIAAAWNDQRLIAEIEKRRGLIAQCRDDDPAQNEALMQFEIMAEILRRRLGSRPRDQRMQTRTRRGKYGGMNK